MRSPAHAFAWEFRQGHGFALMALAGYALVLGTIALLMPGPWEPMELDTPNETAAVVIGPFALTFMYLLAVFSFGLAGDLVARKSIYPARLFTLPVTNAALAGWPMLYGAAAMASLWLATVFFALRPFGLDLPLIWPGVLAVAFLAWTQALMWMPYGLPGLRVIVAVLWLVSLDAVVLVAVHYETSETLMIAFLAPQLPLAYLAACYAVRRARRGEVPDWRGLFSRRGPFSRLGRVADLPHSDQEIRRAPFASPARAQLWFEWRRHGRSLPACVGMLLPFELALLFVAGDGGSELVVSTLLGVLLTPLCMASFAVATVSQPSPDLRDSRGMTPFDATRPLSSAALVAAQLKVAIWSTLTAWLLVLVATPLALTWSSTWPVVLERTARWLEGEGTLRAVAIVLLVFLGLLGLTWKALVQNLSIGLTGREWIVKASVFFTLSFLVLFGPMAGWILSLFVMSIFVGALPWIALVCLKISAFAWIATRLLRQRLLGGRTLLIVAAGWLAGALALYGLLGWLVTTPLIPRFLLAAVAILAVPLARLSAAPLALAWNRHRLPSRTARHPGALVLRAALVLGLPVVSVLVASVWFHFLNPTSGEIVSSGQEREYLLHVPSRFDHSKPAPLVISLHGGAGWPALQRDTSRWNRLADEHGFLVVYPAGSGAPKSWHVDRESSIDVRFISELIDRLEATYKIDPTRIYADGLSNGGGMAFVLSCTLSARIAAVGMVAAAYSLEWSWCTDHRPVPMIAFHGTADVLTPYHGGRSPVFPDPFVLPSIPTWTANWARRNRCATKPLESTIAADVTRLEYPNCADDADVVLYTVLGGGHTWPGGGPIPEWLAGRTSNGVDATSQMWAFFREHPLPKSWQPD